MMSYSGIRLHLIHKSEGLLGRHSQPFLYPPPSAVLSTPWELNKGSNKAAPPHLQHAEV